MADWSLVDGQVAENAGWKSTQSRGTTLTGSTATNQLGAYAQLIAATARKASALWVMMDDCSAAADALVDVAIGSTGAETIIAPKLTASAGTGSIVYGANYMLPITVPAGVRLSARLQSSLASGVVRVSALLLAKGFAQGESGAIVTTYGASTTDSGGTSVDPGGVAHTKGAYVAVAAATTYPIKYLIIGIGNQINTVRTSQTWLIDVAIGSSGNEVVILPDVVANTSTTPDTVTPQASPPLPVSIPAGTRLAVRAQSDGIDATDRLFDVILYGIT